MAAIQPLLLGVTLNLKNTALWGRKLQLKQEQKPNSNKNKQKRTFIDPQNLRAV